VCGPDLGTGPWELAEVRKHTPFVNPEQNDAGASTAAGVAAGLRAVFSALQLRPGPKVTVAIQGLGAVGRTLANTLVRQGVRVIGSDISEAAIEQAKRVGVEIVDPDRLLTMECDVLSPCAGGGAITPEVVPTLRCRAICGSANNPLVGEETGEALRKRRIAFAPDIVVNAGAVIEGVYTVLEGERETTRAKIRRSIDSIEGTTAEILATAAERDASPNEVARDMARARLQEF
jgi:leucine dehydrogenase